ncbi:hypothetical protein [Rhizobium mesoamericanum]|uniref:hypothetical protein n=1 Tax=Rhizobium mesoamericanum TaxID=1079800 RepID=UPI0012DD5F3F|nr:hypothetical protein [Rhizobium mesoamericanum]
MYDRRTIALGLMLTITLLGATDAFSERQAGPDRSNCQAPAQQQSPNAPARGGDRERDLSKCGGVIVPPKSGDEVIEHPAPEIGTTPVIPPSDLPGHPFNHGKPE